MSDAGASPPEFIIIGAAKAGSTALFRAVARHPGVFACREKEPRFFAFAGGRPVFQGPRDERALARIVTEEAAYRRLFLGARAGLLRGEASTVYLYSDKAARVAHQYAPKARLIAMLRQPVERGYSQWLHQHHNGAETLADFADAWDAEPDRLRAGWAYLWAYRGRGFYGRQLDQWLEHYPREQLLVLFYDDWIAQPQDTLARVWRHLGLEPLPNATIRRENVTSRQPRWRWLQDMMIYDNALRRSAQRTLPLAWRDAVTDLAQRFNLTRVAPPLDPVIRRRLTVEFYDDLKRVEDLTQRDLDAWRR
jgi:hypothetical protein